MSSNRLKLNPTKSEFLWCTTLRRRHLLDGSTFALADAEVLPADVIRNLGVYFDSCLTRTAHMSQLVRSCFYLLRRIKTIRKFIPTSIAVVLVNSFIVSSATALETDWRVCRFASWTGYNRCLMLLHVLY